MRRFLVLVLMIVTMLTPAALACEENEGGVWETGDMLAVTGCREWVSLRRTASTKAGRLNKIPLGESVYFLSYANNGFCHVAYDGKYGYVLEEYLTYDGISLRYVTGCDEWISLREYASTKADRLTKIPLGEQVTCTAADNGFAWVNYGGKGGYALEKYLSLYPFESGERLYVANCEKYITLRSRPDVHGEEIAKLPKGCCVTMAEEAQNGFVCVECDGLYGYVLPGYLTDREPEMHVSK